MDLFPLPRVPSSTAMKSNRSSTLCVISKVWRTVGSSLHRAGHQISPEPSPRLQGIRGLPEDAAPNKPRNSSTDLAFPNGSPMPSFARFSVVCSWTSPCRSQLMRCVLFWPCSLGARRLSLLGGCPRCPHTSAKAFRSGATAPSPMLHPTR